jgi:AraC-like DNA-binding protein
VDGESDMSKQRFNDYNFEALEKDSRALIYYHLIKPGRDYVPYRWHPEYELLSCLSGMVNIFLVNQEITLHPGESYIIDSNVIHATGCPVPSEIIMMAFPRDLMCFYFPQIETSIFDLRLRSSDKKILQKQRELQQLILEYRKTDESDDENRQLLLNSLALQIIYRLNRDFRIPRPEKTTNMKEKDRQIIMDIATYVYDHYTEKITVKEAAELCHFQPQYFCRFFKKNFGKTFLQFCNEVRLFYAHQEVLNTSKQFNEIAKNNGFGSYNTFRVLFENRYGKSPESYRKEHQ